MARIEKTVFISYRRTDVYTALAVYENLKNQGYDVFFDYRSISSGDFEQIISSNIRARAHFLLILTPTALDRCNEPGDWLRREIEIAIDEKRNIVPLFFKGFRFGAPFVTEKLTGKLKNLSRYNGLNVHEDYFDEAIHRLRTQYLNIPLDTVLHPVSTQVQKVVRAEQVAADKALEEIEDIKELVKQADEKPIPLAKPESLPASKTSVPVTIPNFNFRLIGGLVGGVLLLALIVWGGVTLLNNPSLSPPEQSPTSQLTMAPAPLPAQTNTQLATHPPQPTETNTSIPTETTIPPTSIPGIGSTMTGKDGTTLLYVPAGEFTMGNDTDDALAECQKFRSDCQHGWFIFEKPQHTVNLDAFWVDQTEVTNKMYALCVDAAICQAPTIKESSTHSNYYGNAKYDNYPVIYVDWNMAKTYCEWAGRRLPTEAEWEKAARGPDANIYPWGNTFDATLGNFCDTNCSSDWANKSFNDGFADVSPVGNYPSGKSIYGALDMAGNVSEWVSSLYKPYPYDPTDGRENLTSSGSRVLRGSSWSSPIHDVRSAFRLFPEPVYTSVIVGFRCAMSATP